MTMMMMVVKWWHGNLWRTHGENCLILVFVTGDDDHDDDIKIEMSVKMVTMMMNDDDYDNTGDHW